MVSTTILVSSLPRWKTRLPTAPSSSGPPAGSAANLRLLTGEYLQLAIAQADLAQDACNQTGIFAEEEDICGFGAVAALYTEACQVIVRADSDIQSIEDLQGKTVSIGAEDPAPSRMPFRSCLPTA